MKIDSGATAWILASSALVLFMTPGLAFFYGGMVRAKSVLNMLMMSFGAIALVSVLWVLYGYSLAFGPDVYNGLIGNLDYIGLTKAIEATTLPEGGIPLTVFAAFQLMFAIITVALISGAIADRAKFGAWMVFVGLWATIVYFPVAHWVFYFDGGNGGWIADRLGALDFAGGTAVHINAGAAGLALALVLGKRHGWPKERFRPHNLPLVLLGAGMLWFGWFGFNAGSAVAANGQAGLAFINTQVAAGAALIGWLVVEKIRDKHATTLGAASGAVAGLVAITPACAAVNPLGAAAIGVIAGVICAVAVSLKYRAGFDDSLDVVGVHLFGGLVGSLLIGLFATSVATGILTPEDATDGANGVFYGGGFELLGKQAIAAGSVLAYSFVATWIIGMLIHKTIGFRVSAEDEVTGIDNAIHAESGYDLVGGATQASGPGVAAAIAAERAETAADVSDDMEPATAGKES